jgi:hypothetical protein
MTYRGWGQRQTSRWQRLECPPPPHAISGVLPHPYTHKHTHTQTHTHTSARSAGGWRSVWAGRSGVRMEYGINGIKNQLTRTECVRQ